MQTTNYNLPDALRRMREGSLVVPQFQRSFVWRESQVKLLVDSLARSYPIGSILLLPKKPDLPLAHRSIEAVIRDDYPPEEILNPDRVVASEVFYVLDGQQRLTSIARVFLNSHPDKTYYFDLKAMLDDFPKEETKWVVSRSKSANEPERKDRNRLLRSDIILDQTKADIFVSEYVEDSGDFVADKRVKREMSARIKGVFECMRNYQIPVVILDKDTGIESICRVFETINSTGTRLTTFDLAVARFFPDPDLRSLWHSVQGRYPLLKDFEVDGERLLQVISLMQAGENETYAEPSRSDLLSLPKNYIVNRWEEAASALAKAYEWAEQQGARPETLPNHGVLVAVAAYRFFLKVQPSSVFAESEAVLRRWYWCKIFQKGARQAANYKIGRDFTELLNYVKNGITPSFQKVNLESEDLLSLRPSEVMYKSFQCLLSTLITQDLITGQKINAATVLEDHHIFPRSFAKTKGKDFEILSDSIANKIMISRDANRQISEEMPYNYFGKLVEAAKKNGTIDDFKRRVESTLIPGDPRKDDWVEQFKPDNMKQFCRSRSKMIFSRLSEIIGDSLEVNSNSDIHD